MKRASSASKTKSTVPGAKRKPRRRLAAAKKILIPTKRKPITKAKPVAKRKPRTGAGRIAKAGPIAKRKSVIKSKALAERKAKPTPGPQPTAKTKPAVRRSAVKKSRIRRRPVKIPAYLLAGDVPVTPAVASPGMKFALGPEAPAAHFTAETAHLPEAYGTGRLYVTPRDPHWLYAYWDITPQQQFRHNAQSIDRHLILRIHAGEVRGCPVAEIHVHPESRYWFAHVEQAATVYVTELGYYQTGRRWQCLATSAPAKMPADQISTDATVEFATIPLESSFETMLGLLKEGTSGKLPLARALEQLRATGQSRLIPPAAAMSEWPPEQEQALAEFVARARTTGSWPSSHEISELVGGQRADEIVLTAPGEFDLSSFMGGADTSSPFGGEPGGGNDFWLQLDAGSIPPAATEFPGDAGAQPQDQDLGLPPWDLV